VNSMSLEGSTPLMLAAELGDTQAATYLIQAGAIINLKVLFALGIGSGEGLRKWYGITN